MSIKQVSFFLLRIFLGATFAFSGFTKAVDPLGTAYKITDYMTFFFGGAAAENEFSVCFSVLLSAFEFVIGMCLLFALFLSHSIRMSLIFLCAFTPLTLWIALYNPVSDCGCFGDAMVLNNWQTFVKNLFLLFFALFLYFRRNIVHYVGLSNNVLYPLTFLSFSILISSYSLYDLPLIDFRPYQIGTDIRQGMTIPAGEKRNEYSTSFLMEKDGVRKTFWLHDYPDTTWKLLETKVELRSEGYKPPINDFFIKTMTDKKDVTDSILSASSVLLMVMPYVESASQKNVVRFNELYNEAKSHEVGFYAVTASTGEGISEWRERTSALYPFMLMDATTLKTIIRSSPGLVLLKNGVVRQKWSHNFLPESLESYFCDDK